MSPCESGRMDDLALSGWGSGCREPQEEVFVREHAQHTHMLLSTCVQAYARVYASMCTGMLGGTCRETLSGGAPGGRRGFPAPPGLPGSSQAGCFLPSVTPYSGAGPIQGDEEGQGCGSTSCDWKISAKGQVIAGLAVLGKGELRVLGSPSLPQGYWAFSLSGRSAPQDWIIPLL